MGNDATRSPPGPAPAKRDALEATLTLTIEAAGPLFDEMSEESIRRKIHKAFEPVAGVLRKRLGTVKMETKVRRVKE